MNPAMRIFFLVVLFILTLTLAGCATLGPIDQKVDKTPENSGLLGY